MNISNSLGRVLNSIQSSHSEQIVLQNLLYLIILPITVFPTGFLVGVDDDQLNSQVVPIRSVSPEGVHDFYQEFYRTSYFSP